MISSLDPPELQATISDFERRIALLEEMIHGTPQQDLPIDFLLGLYLDAQRELPVTPELGRHWVRQAYLLDARQLLTLVRRSHDLHPWRPILHIIDRYVDEGYEPAVGAQAHLLSIAQDLLNAQGLELIRPRDVMGHQLPMQAAISAISR